MFQIHRNAAAALAAKPNSLGFLLWHTFRDNGIHPQDMENALLNNGLDLGWMLGPRTHYSVFQLRTKRSSASYQVAGEPDTRKLVFASLKITPAEAITVCHTSRSIDGGGRHSAQAAPVGYIRIDRNTNACTWRFEGVDRGANETDADYTARRIAHVRSSQVVQAECVETFANLAASFCAEVAARGGRIDSVILGRMVLEALRRPEMNAVLCRQQGGLYFVPSIPKRGPANPVALVAAFATAIESVNASNQFSLIPLDGNPSALRSVQQGAQESLQAEMHKVLEEVQKLTAIKQIKQVYSRQEKIKGLLTKAQVYADLYSVRVEEIQKAAQDARAHLNGLKEAYKRGTDPNQTEITADAPAE